MKIKMVAQSEVGKIRKINEDFYGIFEEDNLAVLCDGMGGHKAGAHASQLAVSTIRYRYIFLEPYALILVFSHPIYVLYFLCHIAQWVSVHQS